MFFGPILFPNRASGVSKSDSAYRTILVQIGTCKFKIDRCQLSLMPFCFFDSGSKRRIAIQNCATMYLCVVTLECSHVLMRFHSRQGCLQYLRGDAIAKEHVRVQNMCRNMHVIITLCADISFSDVCSVFMIVCRLG